MNFIPTLPVAYDDLHSNVYKFQEVYGYTVTLYMYPPNNETCAILLRTPSRQQITSEWSSKERPHTLEGNALVVCLVVIVVCELVQQMWFRSMLTTKSAYRLEDNNVYLQCLIERWC